jgi:hypothetical protein
MAAKVYQNVSISQLLEWSQGNPHRLHSLKSITIQPAVTGETDTGTSMAWLGLETYSAVPVTGILDVIAWIRDPMFAMALPTIRSTIVRDLVTVLQKETDTLAGSSFARKRRRIYDSIGAAFHGTPPLDDAAMKDLVAGLAHLTRVNLVFVRDARNLEESVEDKPEELGGASKGMIGFSSNPETWVRETPVWIVDWHGRWLAIPNDSDSVPTTDRILGWLGYLETNGWVVDWPPVDATKEALVEELSQGVTWQSAHAKLKKDVLATRLGRERILRALMAWKK